MLVAMMDPILENAIETSKSLSLLFAALALQGTRRAGDCVNAILECYPRLRS
jgi:hypothetical protein